MSRYRALPVVVRVAVIALVVAPVLVVAFVPAYRPSALMARHLYRQLEVVPDELVTAQLQQIGDLDATASPLLVESLGSERSVVAGAAGSELHRLLDRWAMQRSAESAPKVARVAQLLSTRTWTSGIRRREVWRPTWPGGSCGGRCIRRM